MNTTLPESNHEPEEARRYSLQLAKADRDQTDVDLLIAVGTLFAAIYAIVPRDRQLDLQLRLDLLDLFVLVAGSLTVLYLQFYDFFDLRGFVFARPWPSGVTPGNTTYLVLLGMMVWLVLRMTFTRLTLRKLDKFRLLLEELYWGGAFGELFSLLQKYRKRLFDIYNRRTFRSRYPMTTRSSRSHERGPEIIQEIIRTLFVSPKFVASLARTRPYLGLDILSAWSGDLRYDFLTLYFRELLADSTSVFYAEISDSRNIASERYYVSPSNRLLNFFLNDASVAYRDAVYKPIGDYCLTYLDQLARDSTDPYCLAMDDFREVGAWHSPLFATLHFFDIMVREALFQGIEWHMWLYYLPLFVHKYARNFKIEDPLANSESEWPNRYSFLMYRTIDVLCDWVRAAEEVPPDQPNVVLRSLMPDHQNNNIPKSAILALTQSLRHVLDSRTIGADFKAYILEVVLHLYFNLRGSENFQDYATVLRTAVAWGGGYKRRTDTDYWTSLMEAFGRNLRECYITQRREFVKELEEYLHESEPQN